MDAPLPESQPRWVSPKDTGASSEGPYVIEFAEAFCRLPTDSYAGNAGDLIVLRDWQKQLVCDLYELRPDGRRRHRRGLIGLPKKNGKSLLSSILCLDALVNGPPGSEIYVVANAKHQARIVFEPVARMVASDPELSDLLEVQRNAIFNPVTGSVFRPLTADVGSNDGLNPYLVIFDEVHEYQNRKLWDQVHNATATRPNALLLGITTAGWDKGTLCYERYEHGKRVATGEVIDPSFFFRWWEPAAADAPLTLETFAEANPGLGDFQGIDETESLLVSNTPANALRRYRLNQWTGNYEAWLKAGAWEVLETKERKPVPGEAVTLGFDGSLSNDSTALVACSLDDNHIFVIDAWEKPADVERNEEWRVPIEEVEDAIRLACATYDVAEVACDPAHWARSIEILLREGLPMVTFPNSPARMIPATMKFEAAVYDRRLSHDGDPRLARHIGNAVAVERNGGIQIYKETKNSPRKIDLAIAAILAHDRATYLAANRTEKVRPRVFFVDV